MSNRIHNKKVFCITGGCGFIGSHFIETVLELGHTVHNIDKLTYAANRNLNFQGDYHFIEKDICKIKSIPHCDFIVNFAAESHVDNSINANKTFMNANIMGVYNILEILKNNHIKNYKNSWNYNQPLLLHISTDEVLGDILEGEFYEGDRHKPSNPYAATKSAAEQLITAWARTYNIPYLITRTTNNYGPRQHPEKLIPNAITKILSGKKVPIHGNGDYTRNWIHVRDNVSAILKVLDVAPTNDTYHISSQEELSIKEVVSTISACLGTTFDDVAEYGFDRNGADVRYALNCDKVKALGWKCERNFDSSIEEMIEYYRK